ncbi:hypothetical protein LPJ63_004729, partial [Coemansia sp. RSA 2711]
MAQNNTPGIGTGRRPGWATRSAVAAVAIQLMAFVLLVLFMDSSLDPASIPSRLMGRDIRAVTGYRASSHVAALAPLFDVNRALDDLAAISKTPHSLNDPRSIEVRDYLRAAIHQAIGDTSAEFSDPLANGTAAEFKAKGWLMHWEDSSLIVRVPGTGDNDETLLVQAHYDAVPMSHGTFDDGVGVVVCLELLRSLAQRPTRHPVVINIDWGEENGLVGAMLFARFHPWADSVRAYINLEAGGVGGRAMLFRASHPSLLQAYKQAVNRPCASLVGNNAFRLGIVKSDTDYSVYTTRYGIPGLDLAFTDRRSLYHTAHDNIEHATADSILSMGLATLDTVRQIADSDRVLPRLPRSPRLPERPRQITGAFGVRIAAEESFGDTREDITIKGRQHVVVAPPTLMPEDVVEDAVFYDVLSRFMVVRSYTAELLLNLFTGLIGIAAVIGVQYPFMRALPDDAGSVEWVALAPTERLVMQLGRGGLFGALLQALTALARAYFAGLFGSLVFTGIMITLVAPRLAYSHLLMFVLLLFSAAALSVTSVLSSWACRSRSTDVSAMVWYAHCLFRCLVLLTVVVPLNSAKIGLLYREQLYAWASIGAVLCTALMDADTAVGQMWRQWARRLATKLTTRQDTTDSHQERLLDTQRPENSDSEDVGMTSPGSYPSAVAIGLHAISVLRVVVGAALPLAAGMDIMLRQLTVFKDHLADGSPPFACVAIAALDIVTFIMLLAPYIVDVIVHADDHWLVRTTNRVIEPCLGLVLSPLRSGRPAFGTPRVPSRSQISLHTNYPDDGEHATSDETYPRVMDYSGENSDSDANERVILLGSGDHASAAESHLADAPLDSSNDTEDTDDGLGRRRLSLQFSKGESPETIGMRMIYMWTGIWLVLWVLTQLITLTGEGYNENASPLKVRVFQSTRISAECTGNPFNASDECAISRLSLSSQDSAGLTKLIQMAAPADMTPSCFTLNTRGYYKCNFAYRNRRVDSATDKRLWSPESAITVVNISHTVDSSDN